MDRTPDEQPLEMLPSYLSVEFSPSNLPSGAISLGDFLRFHEGIQEISDGIVEYEFGEGDFEGYHYTIAEIRQGSIISLLIHQLLTEPAFWIGAGVGSSSSISSIALIALLKSGKLQDAARWFKSLSAKQHRLFLDNLGIVTADVPQQLDAPLLENMVSGLKKIAEVGSLPPYQEKGILVSSDLPTSSPIVVNSHTSENILRLLREESTGSEVVYAGQVRVINSSRNYIRIHPDGGNKGIQCRFEQHLKRAVLKIATIETFVIVTGIPYYRLGATSTGFPSYLRINNIALMPNLFSSVSY